MPTRWRDELGELVGHGATDRERVTSVVSAAGIRAVSWKEQNRVRASNQPATTVSSFPTVTAPADHGEPTTETVQASR